MAYNAQENEMWRFIHNCVAHPLLFFTWDSAWSVRFHDWSSEKMHERYPKLYKRIDKMKCPQCEIVLVEPRGLDKYCETCGFPDENRCEFNLVEIKAYLRSMFQKQNCAEDVRAENHSLACAYNLLTDESLGLAKFCDDGKAEGLTLGNFAHVRI